MADPQERTYQAAVGLDLPGVGRIEPGEVFQALGVVQEFLDQGLVRDVTPADAPEPVTTAPVVDATPVTAVAVADAPQADGPVA